MKNFLKYSALCFLLLLGTHLLGAPSGAEADSSKSRYPLNDPRNPNCPCHKYQEQADREYARQIALSKQKGGKDQIETQTFTEQRRLKKLRTTHRLRLSSSNRKVKATKRKCFRDRLSRCFHF